MSSVNIKIWCKSFLSIYHIIPNIVRSIDKLVYLKSVNSSCFRLDNKNETVDQIENIVSLTQRKVNLINLKLLTDEVLLEMNTKKAKILKLRFIDNIKCKKAIELSGLSRRTYFRTLNNAFTEFESLFFIKILKSEKLYKAFSTETFFEDIFNKVNTFNSKVNTQADTFDDEKYSKQLCSLIVTKMKKCF